MSEPVPMRLPCPECGKLHIDEGDFATKVHHTHSCQFCGLTWRPAVVPTVGVQFLPGFKNEEPRGQASRRWFARTEAEECGARNDGWECSLSLEALLSEES